MNLNKDIWPLIEFFWEQNPPDSAHIRSFNDFIGKIPDFVNNTFVYEKFKLEICDVRFIAPSMRVAGKMVKTYPSQCILDKETYESEINCTFKFFWENKLVKEESNISIGSIPVMTGSELCNLVNVKRDERYIEQKKLEFMTGLGGWFVKDGIARVITFQERSKFNHPMAFDYTGTINKTKKYTFVVEVRNSVTEENTTAKLTANKHKNGHIFIEMEYLDKDKPVAALLFFHALGFSDPKQIYNFIFSKNDPLKELPEIKMQVLKMFELAAQYDWVDTLCCLGREWSGNENRQVKLQYIEEMISKKFLHHYNTNISKAYYFGLILHDLISLSFDCKAKYPEIRFVKPEDRDHFGQKVLNTESVLFSNVFYTAVKKMNDIVEKNIIKTFEGKNDKLAEAIVKELNSKILFPESDITKMPISMLLSKALTNNMWGNEKRDGVSTIYDPINYNNAVVLMMRSCLPIKSFNGKLAPRMVHGSYWGIIDFFDTPEGENIGYNKVLSVSTFISNWVDDTAIKNYLLKHIDAFDEKFKLSNKKVYIDNQWIGNCSKEKCMELYNNIKLQKKSGRIDPTISIVWNDVKEELHVMVQEGRILRPYLVVENGKILLTKAHFEMFNTWESFLALGVVEMLDPNEIEFCKIAPASIEEFHSMPLEKQLRTDYCDIHPATLFGAGAGSITSPHMTQGPRNSYGANMARQAIGTTTRFDAPRNLFYPQKALVRNKIASLLLHYDEYPAGMNVTLALMPGLGFEQEDGYILNKSFVEMGGFMTNKITKHVITIEGADEIVEIPKESECFKFKPKDITNLDKNGIIKKGSIVEMNEPLCGKTVLANNGSFKKMDTTLFHREETTCYVEDVVVNNRGYRGSKIIKIILRETRIGKCGNKYSPRSAQKGTATYICTKEDMPFDPCRYGTPTITMIANPLCIPSRMTICYLEELFLGNYTCLPDAANLEKGKKGVYEHLGYENCTPYDEDPESRYENVRKTLLRMGFRPDGCKSLIDGRTGQMITTNIFVGQTHIQTLKHMVDDKITKRATGPVAALMKCPTEGRSKSGGVKMGVMEKDVAAGNDCPYILLDRLCTSSDQIFAPVCKYCGVIESYNKMTSAKCKSCNANDAMKIVVMSNSPKVVFQELMGMCIMPRILLAPE